MYYSKSTSVYFNNYFQNLSSADSSILCGLIAVLLLNQKIPSKINICIRFIGFIITKIFINPSRCRNCQVLPSLIA